ncbi:MAG TPA: hypothetical protein IGS53_24395 [Leptolyngbyaceae cyanobacterium M33_DOE_097]|uniref:Glycosyl hydrolase-like 10 domain-containing protein n=1 Tax=Oscillatoriales cyanobacterium SpSt-418 TaxID=2282169 RepID=A0A7C3PFV5_9CYAN|nr:hypothetical protein [Leptolyngbyaceae cyanobacterium M33_DOE_097]
MRINHPFSQQLAQGSAQFWQRVGCMTALGLFASMMAPASATAQVPPYCQQTPQAIAEKSRLLRALLKGDRKAANQYKGLVAKHAAQLQRCRRQTWPQTAAIWLRLYPCDARPGSLEAVMDRIVDRGYSQVYVETFATSKVLLPEDRNPTPWRSVMAGTRARNVDLLGKAIQKGRDRGLKVYSWMFTLNFGSDYFNRGDRSQALARNGFGQDTLTARLAPVDGSQGFTSVDDAFVDPYDPQARKDFANLVNTVMRHKPDGVLFDYVRYPRLIGAGSVTSRVQDLWIYGNASRTIFFRRALNYKGMELMRRYLQQGFLKVSDLKDVNQQYPQEGEPMWQGRTNKPLSKLPLAQQVSVLQSELWRLSIAHAFQGVYEFLNVGVEPVRRAKLPAGVVFFPEGNQSVGQGYDSRLQFWEYFPQYLEWHPMSYAVCGKPDCIVNQIRRVLTIAPNPSQVKPVLAGIWQEKTSNRPPLEVQVQALRQSVPQLRSLSHFAYSWQEPGSDRDRKYCTP